MKNKLRAKIIALCILSGALSGCGKEQAEIIVNTEPIPVEKGIETEEIAVEVCNSVNEETTKVVNITIDEVEQTKYEDIVTATTNVNIRNNECNGDVIGLLHDGDSLKTFGFNDYGVYEVDYNGNVAYVSADYVVEGTREVLPSEVNKVVYIVNDTMLSTNILVPANEVLEVYKETEDSYLVNYNGNTGYINKTNTQDMNGTYVVVDLSDQTLKLYSDNQVLIDTVVVTGKKSTPTHEGKFQIFAKNENRYLQGKWFVNVFMPFDGGRGLHDAEYHTDDNGFRHGWRSPEEFGTENYVSGGSHGCVNMLHDDAIKAYNLLNVGDTVIVKK